MVVSPASTGIGLADFAIMLLSIAMARMGGMGVLVLFLALMPRTGAGAVHLMRAESPGPIKSKLLPHVSDTAKVLYGIYIGLTAAEIVALCLAGMDFYEAVLHSFSTISIISLSL